MVRLLLLVAAFGGAAAPALAQVNWYWDGPASTPANILAEITASMDEAIDYYNAHALYSVSAYSTNSRGIRVIYDAAVPTANASYRGRISFGASRGVSTALHEMGHVFGVGTFEPTWTNLLTNGRWTGAAAIAEVRRFDGPSAVVNGDTNHFWPYGLNFSTEDSIEARRRHVRMVGALRQDMGLFNGNATEILGDYNNDGVVDAADYTVYRDRVGELTSLVNDFSIGFIGGRDVTVWQQNYGRTLPPAASAVPEVGAIAGALACGLIRATMPSRRRRGRG